MDIADRTEPVDREGWNGWYFEHDYLVSPNGDRFSPRCIMACFFWKQMVQVRSVLKTEPDLHGKDALLSPARQQLDMRIGARGTAQAAAPALPHHTPLHTDSHSESAGVSVGTH